MEPSVDIIYSAKGEKGREQKHTNEHKQQEAKQPDLCRKAVKTIEDP